ncbi:hypothetical protein WJ40_20035 [Burkholderia cepacia]|nr:hypothetical protein WJ40_20035 [Burkholderia cepacia]
MPEYGARVLHPDEQRAPILAGDAVAVILAGLPERVGGLQRGQAGAAEQPVDAGPGLIHAPVQFLPGNCALLQRLLQSRQGRMVGDGCAQVRPARQQDMAPGVRQILQLPAIGTGLDRARPLQHALHERLHLVIGSGDQQEHGSRISLPVLAVVPDQHLFASTGGYFVIVVVPGVVQLLESPMQAVDGGVWQRVGPAGERECDADQNRQEACEAFSH